MAIVGRPLRVARKRFQLAENESVVLYGLAARVGRVPGAAGGLCLTERRLLFTQRRWRGLRSSDSEDLLLTEVAGAIIGTRWNSLRSGLWFASTLVLELKTGRLVKLSTYGARVWAERINSLVREQ